MLKRGEPLSPIRQIEVEVRMRIIEALTGSNMVGFGNPETLLAFAQATYEWVYESTEPSEEKGKKPKK